MSEYIEFRAYVGPQWLPDTSAYFYNWSAINAGGTDNFAYSTTLTSMLSSGGITANVSSASLFPSAGGAWIGPAAGGEGWEYCRYNGKGATSLNALVRPTSNIEHNSNHGVGAVVRFWFPLENHDDGNLSISSTLNDKWNVRTWSATLSGVLAPKNVLRPGHVVVIQSRVDPAGTWTNYRLGWISQASIIDDYGYTARWSVSLVSSAQMIETHEAPVIVAGEINLLRSGTVEASTTLAAAWKERQSNDYVAAYPSFDAGNVADDDSNSLWISEKYLGTGWTEYVVGGPGVGTTILDTSIALSGGRILADGAMFTQMHLTPPAGYPDGYRWIEITFLANQSWVGPRVFFIGTEATNTLDLSGQINDLQAGQRLIICENAERFAEENPNNGAAQILDLTELGQPDFLKRPVAGGSIGIFRTSPSGNAWLHVVCWGTATNASVLLFGTTTYTSYSWPGTTISALSANSGYTLRYNWTNVSTAKNNWTYDIIHFPGYEIGAAGAKEWLMVEMPSMQLSLKSDITSGFTGVTTLTTPGGDSSAGLARSGSTTIQIGSEQMTATIAGAETINITARAQNGTAAAAHVAGDPIYVVDGGVATDAYLINKLSWVRSGGTSYPTQFKVYTSKYQKARNPTEPSYTLDWSTPISVAGHLSPTWASSAISRRARNVLIEIEKMTTDPSRARLNAIAATVDPGTFEASAVITTGNSGDVAAAILDAIGIPSGAWSETSTNLNIKRNATAKGAAWSVIEDLADYGSLTVAVDAMSKIAITDDVFWINDVFVEQKTWSRTTAISAEFSSSYNDRIAQVILPWSAADGSDSGTVYYPATPDGNGKSVTIDEMILPDSSTATTVAQKKYLQARYSWSIQIQSANGYPAMEAGDIDLVSWDIDPSLTGTSRRIIDTDVQHTISNRVCVTSVQGVEIQRYTDEQ